MTRNRKPQAVNVRQNMVEECARWGRLAAATRKNLRYLTEMHGVCVATGEIILLGGSWYVTHSGLLRIAREKGCVGIRTTLEKRCSDPDTNRWVFRTPRSKGFVGFGDADPSNVSSLVRGAEMRVAETRAVNRALRKAYGIGLCSVEELGWSPRSSNSEISDGKGLHPSGRDGRDNGHCLTSAKMGVI